jgi:hypothetical protein
MIYCPETADHLISEAIHEGIAIPLDGGVDEGSAGPRVTLAVGYVLRFANSEILGPAELSA